MVRPRSSARSSLLAQQRARRKPFMSNDVPRRCYCWEQHHREKRRCLSRSRTHRASTCRILCTMPLQTANPSTCFTARLDFGHCQLPSLPDYQPDAVQRAKAQTTSLVQYSEQRLQDCTAFGLWRAIIFSYGPSSSTGSWPAQKRMITMPLPNGQCIGSHNCTGNLPDPWRRGWVQRGTARGQIASDRCVTRTDYCRWPSQVSLIDTLQATPLSSGCGRLKKYRRGSELPL